MSKCKFRISLSLEQMQYISGCPDCPPDLKRLIDIQLMKATTGYVQPAFTVKTEVDLAPEIAYRKACQYLDAGQQVPVNLLPRYNEYRYLNDLMSPEEAAEYELTI